MSHDTIGEPPKDYAPEDHDDPPHKRRTLLNGFVGAVAVFLVVLAVINYPLATATFTAGVACALIYRRHDDGT